MNFNYYAFTNNASSIVHNDWDCLIADLEGIGVPLSDWTIVDNSNDIRFYKLVVRPAVYANI